MMPAELINLEAHLLSDEAQEPLSELIVRAALVYPDRRLLRPAVRAFVDFSLDWLARDPIWAPTEASR